MAGAFITVTPSGQESVLTLLKNLYERTGDLSTVMADIGEALL